MEGAVQRAFKPCGHVVCKDCSAKLAQCHVCRMPIEGRVVVLLAKPRKIHSIDVDLFAARYKLNKVVR